MHNHLNGGIADIGNMPVPSEVCDSTDLIPLNTHVYVKPDAPVEKVGALFVPPSSTTQCTGLVIASDTPLCQPGDRVVYSRFWPFDFEGNTIVCCLAKDLVGVKRAALIEPPATVP